MYATVPLLNYIFREIIGKLRPLTARFKEKMSLKLFRIIVTDIINFQLIEASAMTTLK